MIIECQIDPWELVGEIGDPNFFICGDDEELFRHPDHPFTLRITDAEANQHIDITGESTEDTRNIAECLCKLLNQSYWVPGKRMP